MNTIVYLIYGSRREYQLELTYSVLSAAHFIGKSRPDYRILLISDGQMHRSDLPVEHLMISPQEFSRWTGNGSYNHAAKVHALLAAMDASSGKVALIDTDTYFRVHPDHLFDRISPASSVMQADEGLLGNFSYWSPLLTNLHGPVASHEVNGRSVMFNSGVVGVHTSMRKSLEEVLPLIDGLYAIHPVFNIEQFAYTAVLQRHTQLTACPDVVAHYWGHERRFMHAQIGSLFPEMSVEAFEKYLPSPPKVGYPPKRLMDQLRARLKSLIRRDGGSDYRFAYLAYLSALSGSQDNALNASVWARIALDVLQRHPYPVSHIKQDFCAMRKAQTFAWLKSDVRENWVAFWQALPERN